MRHAQHYVIFCTVLVFGFQSFAQAQPMWQGREFNLQNGHNLSVGGINNNGILVGAEWRFDGAYDIPFAFYKVGEALNFYSSPNGSTVATAINDSNVAVGFDSEGYFADISFSNVRAVRFETNGVTRLVDIPGYERSIATDINNSGKIIGVSFKPDKTFVSWVWDNGVVNLLPVLSGYLGCIPEDINNLGQIVGNCHSTLPNPNETVPHETGKYSFVSSTSRGNDSRAVFWDSSLVVHALKLLPGFDDVSRSFNLNDKGEIVGKLIANDFSTGYKPTFWPSYQADPLFLRIPDKNILRGGYHPASVYSLNINNHSQIIGLTFGYFILDSRHKFTFWHNQHAVGEPIGYFEPSAAQYIFNNAGYTHINDCGSFWSSGLYTTAPWEFFNPNCQCGVNTGDTNNNQIMDCMEPTANSIPSRPFIGYRGSRVFVSLPSLPPNLGYKTVVEIYNKKNKRIAKKSTTSFQVEFKKLFGRTRKGQNLTVKSRIYWTNGTTTTKRSTRVTKKFKVR